MNARTASRRAGLTPAAGRDPLLPAHAVVNLRRVLPPRGGEGTLPRIGVEHRAAGAGRVWFKLSWPEQDMDAGLP
jgi:hypothetical protein